MRVTAIRFARAQSAVKLPAKKSHITPRGESDKRLTHVVSEELCDDVLQLLKPSLPPPQTCDIIDLNPGTCLWSQKLHQVLKPRRHILVEPRIKTFSQYIDPLLHDPGSSYKHVPDIKSALEPNNQFLSEDIYRFRDKIEHEGGAKYALNKNLIVVANLSGSGRLATGFHGSAAKQFFNEFYRSVFVRNDFIHRYGLVRLLAWIGEDARIPVMPTSVSARTKQSIQLESACTITQVAGPSQFRSLYPHQQRWFDLDVENQENVRSMQKQLGLAVPPERDQPEPQLPFVALNPTIQEVRQKQKLYPYNQIFIDRLLELDQYLSTNSPDWYAMYEGEAKTHFADKSKYVPATKSDETQRTYRVARNQMRTQYNTYMKTKDFIWEQRQVLRKIQQAWVDGWFAHSTGLPVKGPHRKQAQQLIDDDQNLELARLNIKVDTRKTTQKAGDDWRCYSSSPASLAWNRRQHEPLLVRDNEFHPKKPLSLFDFVPNPEFPARLDTVDKQICFDHVCTLLMTTPNDTVVEGIQRLTPGGYNEFLERLPQLRDPTRTGWYDLKGVKVRSLHHDHFIDIALTFHDWPHRPPIEKLMVFHKGVFADLPK